ncbi:MAG TPA: sigma 54-interacting transcriptional regulator [Bryobacteraceae bacterium]|nr:sigma 54-interacting transcriptional regulator [Bryobacteraceae bacterium]
MNPRLLLINGPEQGASYPIAMDSFAIGRGRRNQLWLADASVSREHCLILRQGDDFVIHDLGSHHGTLVNDTRVTERVLVNGDCLRIGGSQLRFVIDEEIDCPETSGDIRIIEIPAGAAQLPVGLENSRDLHTLLRMSIMLHSFHALYQARSSTARSALERHLLEFIFEAIPASRGAILLYEGDLNEPSSLSVRSAESAPHRPVVIDRALVGRVTHEHCGLIVENLLAEHPARAGSEKSVALLLAPLLIREQVYGIVYLEGAAFREPHLQLLVAIAQIASMALENAFHVDWLATENDRLESELHPADHMIGGSPRLVELQRNILRAAQANSTVLIIGETGTGKELVARAVHENSPRAGQPFMAVNCAALAENLLESELFGHEKGAFTGAFTQKKGRLEVAAGGTVFLDEIGEMPLQLQVKLLRVLQERQIERVGGTQPIKLDFRLIAATNRNLEEEVRAGRFRQDLYYRLNVVTLKTPPLRERQSDIRILAMHFASKFGAQCGRRISGISPEAEAYLAQYDWPGNIRELENALERAVVLGSSDIIQLEDLPESIREIARPADVVRAPGLQDAVDHAKRDAIAKAFQRAKDDHAGAAKALGVHPNYLYRLMRNLGMR